MSRFLLLLFLLAGLHLPCALSKRSDDRIHHLLQRSSPRPSASSLSWFRNRLSDCFFRGAFLWVPTIFVYLFYYLTANLVKHISSLEVEVEHYLLSTQRINIHNMAVASSVVALVFALMLILVAVFYGYLLYKRDDTRRRRGRTGRESTRTRRQRRRSRASEVSR